MKPEMLETNNSMFDSVAQLDKVFKLNSVNKKHANQEEKDVTLININD